MKKFMINIFCTLIFLCLCEASFARPKEFRKMVRSGTEFVPNENKILPAGAEPTCDELRAMWRFSRRQSRAAEITNEIPTYRDPFAYNVWDQYPKVRNVVGNYRAPVRPYSQPVYGRIIEHAPSNHPRVIAENKAFDELLRYVQHGKKEDEARRRLSSSAYHMPDAQPQPPQKVFRSGSFQQLKELIWQERTKELQQQRIMEEAAAKAAADRAAQHYNDNNKEQNGNYRYNMNQNPRARFINGENYFESAFAPDYYRKPVQQKTMLNLSGAEAPIEDLW